MVSQVDNVDLDPKGVFKYILIKVTDNKSKESKFIVRGYKRCGYHADILDEVMATERKRGLDIDFDCVGGGRVRHEPEKNEIFVYGYSQGYGQADHKKSVDIIKTKYPSYNVTFSNEGY
ncbi:hypothetical protein L596_007664 [Steinernema carpocapsae]|uniref:Sex-regulated protein janus-B n=1 Tax=Steinernema carpocapsae TaxID=34508 RepID=A0A4U5PA17_STECR|nr:hypothetical protein L596_007664 [Steinernema carpocapsae]